MMSAWWMTRSISAVALDALGKIVGHQRLVRLESEGESPCSSTFSIARW
jgi:hypothetical protein